MTRFARGVFGVLDALGDDGEVCVDALGGVEDACVDALGGGVDACVDALGGVGEGLGGAGGVLDRRL